MSETVKHERRTHFRGRARPGRRIDIRYRRTDGAGETDVAAHTLNIGVGGAFIASDAPAPVGATLLVILDVPTANAPIEVEAEVRWITGDSAEHGSPGMGVKFGTLDVDQLLLLSEYFASLTGADAEAEPDADVPLP